MALSSSSTRDDAIAQYQDNLRYWESSTKASNLVEACLYLLESDAASYSIAGRSVTRQNMQALMDKAMPYAEVGASATRSRFVRAIPVQRFGR